MVEKITLPNGVRIVHENLPYLRSCSVGLWVESGSRHEPEEVNGISHFIEHMMFKGTETRTAAQLASDFDAIGGQVNAFTTKENTCYYCRTLGAYIKDAAGLLCDMFFCSKFDEADTDLERTVIIEEIGMYEDTPDDLVNEELFSRIYGGHKLGRPILGTKESLARITGETMRRYREENYTPENTVVSVCGCYSEEDIKALISVFEKMEPSRAPKIEDCDYKQVMTLKKKDIEQNHLIMAFPSLPLGSERRYDLQVLNSVLGGGMSSRLFQRVRERNGLCYTIYSFNTAYYNTGVTGIYVALNKDTELRAIALIKDVIEELLKDGLKGDELARTVTQLKANVLMGLENTSSRMSTIARNEFIYGREIDEDEIVTGFDAVTEESVMAMAKEIFDFSKVSFSAVGAVKSEAEYREALK